MDLRNALRRTRVIGGALLMLGGLAAAATVAEPPSKRVNTLEGVVVSKKDGKPVAGATVAMAHYREGWIYVENDSSIQAWGAEKKVLFFFSKRNGKTACDTQTDQQGRFALKNFTSTSAKYSIVAGSKEAGLAVLENVVPKDYAAKPLRVEIDEPAYISVVKLPEPADKTLKTSVWVQLEPDSTEAVEDENDDDWALRRNVSLSAYLTPDKSDETQKAGPLVGGKKYRVTQRGWAKRLGSSAILFETVVAAEAGKTTPVEFKNEGGTTLRGRITTKEGSPLRDVNVKMKIGEKGELLLGTLTDVKGNYTISHLPTGTHQLELLRHAVRVGPG